MVPSIVDVLISMAISSILAINDIDHAKTKTMSPQTNGICERFHKTILNEFYQITFRKKLYATLEELQKDLDDDSVATSVLIFGVHAKNHLAYETPHSF